jgi:DHA1 family bicyclomycin/chloramphenicol resistance-like MFS transporter
MTLVNERLASSPSGAPPAARGHSRALPMVLSLLTVFGPISMDLYLPVLPALTRELGAATSTVQLTVTACLLGLALGQLLAGPLSDRFGRRRPLLIGVVLYIVVSVGCAAAPTVEALIAARFVQGLAGAVGIVIAQAAGRDLFSGARLIRFYGSLTVLGGLAAVVGPVLGGQLAKVTDWRGIFLFLAAAGAVILLASVIVVRETLPRSGRTTGGLSATLLDYRVLMSDRVLLGAVLVTGFLNAALFAYLSGATFVLQDTYGLSPQGYSYAFGLNSIGFMIFGWLGGRMAERWSERGTLAVGIALTTLGALGVLITGLADLALPAIVASLFALVSGVALAAAPATSLTLADYPHIAGTASSLLGMARFAFGGLAAPLVGLAGSDATVPLGLVAVTSCVAAAASGVLVGRPAGSFFESE